MAPDRIDGLAYWASGGTVAGRRGPVALAHAAELLAFFNAEAEARLVGGDAAAARFCAELAVELGRAIATAIAWRRCGGPGSGPAGTSPDR